MSTTIDMQQQQPAAESSEFSTTRESHSAIKCSTTSSQTSRTVESSEEFTLSGELTAPSTDQTDTVAATSLHLSNMVIVEELSTSQRPSKVQFAAEPYVITEEDVFVPPAPVKKSKKKNKEAEEPPQEPEQVLPQDLWWSQEELQAIEMNAMYLVKDSQQYQEEVICTVLYNKAFLSASDMGKTIAEDELEERLQDVSLYSNTLETWTAVGNSRRGLENMVSDKTCINAAQARMLVLHFQQELKEGTEEETTSSSSSMAQHAEFLAKRCQDASRSARIMARMMGQADADSLATAESLATPSLPEPPGRYSGDHEQYANQSERIGRRNRRGSMIHSVKKAVGSVFRRQGSREVSMRRIRKMQSKRQVEEEPPKRLSEEFRRSFLEKLGYGEQ